MRARPVTRSLPLLLATLAAAAAPTLFAAPSAVAGGPVPVPVVVELFTSEGCSSCPPADRLLAELLEAQPVDGVEIVPLEFHVDYWNRLGWRDPFSSADFSTRQQRYAAVLRSAVYTPQAVIDGSDELVGSNRGEVLASIGRASMKPKTRVELRRVSGDAADDSIVVGVRVEMIDGDRIAKDVDVLLAVTEDGLATDVRRGENAGRRLAHVAVVRDVRSLGGIDPASTDGFDEVRSINIPRTWDRNELAVVAWLQDRNLRILGAARMRLRD